ncbi:MAG TPA: hypothetical protein VMS17_08240 [Gemmataceae bacterium]|nr:hypothetical protein [Gemmataceae bacterium]
MIELTEEQRLELSQPEPVVVDPLTRETYVLVRRDVYDRMKVLLDQAATSVNGGSSVSLQGESPTLEETFRALADQWREETGMLSSMSKKLAHPAYQKIIALGEPAVPLILRELRDRPGFWFEALKAITRQSPVPPDERTDPRRVRERWLNWGTRSVFPE